MPDFLRAEKHPLSSSKPPNGKRGLQSEGTALRLFQSQQKHRRGILKHAFSESLLTPSASPYAMGSPLFSPACLLPSLPDK